MKRVRQSTRDVILLVVHFFLVHMLYSYVIDVALRTHVSQSAIAVFLLDLQNYVTTIA